MQNSHLMDIIRLCRSIDETARDVYTKLSSLTNDKELSSFWAEMSDEESGHVTFWKRTESLKGLSDIPDIFDKPEKVKSDLKNSLIRSRELLSNCEDDCSVQKSFTLAYRMEFYLLHPAFEMLFHLLGPLVDGPNPEKDYESHIFHFIDMLGKYCHVTPELELLGETLEQLWKENKKLALQSTHDELTEVLNRRGFLTLALQFAHFAQRAESTLAVMMIDLDHFKSVNDNYGHAVGDRVLKGLAQNIQKQLRTSDVVGRYGGEEFIILLTHTRSGAAVELAEKIRKSIEKQQLEGIHITVSIGFVEGKLGQNVRDGFMQLIQQADVALYEAKDTGRNRSVEYISNNG